MKKLLLFLLIAAVIAACIFCPAVSARTAGNTVIESGDIVFIGEQNLDFSKFSSSALTVDSMVMQSGGSIADMITLTNGKGNIGTNIKSGIYIPYNGTTPLNTGMCKVTTLDSVIGSISVSPADGSSISSAQPASVPKGVGVIFSVTGGDISTLETQLSGDWNKMTLKNTDTSQTTSIVKNLAGTQTSLIGIQTPSNPGNSYALKLWDQNTVVPASGTATPMEITFEILLNGITASTKYSFTASSSTLQLTVPTELQLGGTGVVNFTGVTGSTYDVILPVDGPTFVDTGDSHIVIVNESHIRVTPGWDTTVSLTITATESVKLGTYKIFAVNTVDSSEQISGEILVNVAEMTLVFNELYGDVLKGIVTIGDQITFGGTINGAPMQSIPVYLSITGRGLPENGVNLQGEPITDGDASTFTIAYYSPLFAIWEYSWSDTNKFDTGTYTIHANLKPYGFIKSSTPGTEAYKDHLSHEISLTDLSIHARFSESNNGLFAQGDNLYSYWVARGTPNDIRWYIIGTNFLWAGIEEKLPTTQSNQPAGTEVSNGEYGFTYPRNFTMEIDPGAYYLIYQHPGVDNRFDVYPNVDSGAFTTLQTTFGESANVGSMQSDNAAYTLKELISKSFSDDLYVVSEFTIEEPYIHINQEDTLEIGETLVIQGTTNYAASEKTADGTNVGNTFSLLINRLDFELTEENAAMALQIVPRTEPEKTIPYTGERPFTFEEIDTSTWFEGTYEAVVTNINTGFSSSMIFNVVGEGVVKDSANIDVSSNPLEEPDYIIEPLPEIPDYTEPEAPESPGFMLVPLALAAAFILRRK